MEMSSKAQISGYMFSTYIQHKALRSSNQWNELPTLQNPAYGFYLFGVLSELFFTLNSSLEGAIST